MAKTAMQILVDSVNLRIENVTRFSKVNENIEILTTLKVIKSDAERLLEKEKQQIIEAFDSGLTFLSDGEQYYNQQFKQD